MACATMRFDTATVRTHVVFKCNQFSAISTRLHMETMHLLIEGLRICFFQPKMLVNGEISLPNFPILLR